MTPIERLRHYHRKQGRDGRWNYSPQDLGFYNGLEFALAIFEERLPKLVWEPSTGYVTDRNDTTGGQPCQKSPMQ